MNSTLTLLTNKGAGRPALQKIERVEGMNKSWELAGRKVLWTWDNTIWVIVHEVWGKYVIRSMDGNEFTKVEKSEVILINK